MPNPIQQLGNPFHQLSHLKDLALSASTRAKDPDLAAAAGATPQPAPAPLTTDNNRMTFRVPAESTKLNLGQGDSTETATRNQRVGIGTESGIVGQTDGHIHLHTFGTHADSAKTLVRLGTPPTSVPPAGYSSGAFSGIGCLFPQAYAAWNGYSMVTQGAAYQESRQNHLVVSAEGEVRVVGKTLISLASPGDVIIGADPDAETKMLVGNQGDPTAPSAFGNPDDYFRGPRYAAMAMKAAKLLNSTLAMAVFFAKGLPFSPQKGKTGWTFNDTGYFLKVAVKFPLLANSVRGFASGLSTPTAPTGRVAMHGRDSAVVSSMLNTGIFAGEKLTLTGLALASLSSSISTSVSSLAFMSVNGTKTTVGGLAGASLASVLGKVSIKSPKGVGIQSHGGKVTITAAKDLQVNSVDRAIYLHGKSSCYLGTGGSAGFGLEADKGGMFIGNLQEAGTFSFPAPDNNKVVRITSKSIKILMDGSVTEHTAEGITSSTKGAYSLKADASAKIEAPKIDLKGQIITASADKVYLG